MKDGGVYTYSYNGNDARLNVDFCTCEWSAWSRDIARVKRGDTVGWKRGDGCDIYGCSSGIDGELDPGQERVDVYAYFLVFRWNLRIRWDVVSSKLCRTYGYLSKRIKGCLPALSMFRLPRRAADVLQALVKNIQVPLVLTEPESEQDQSG